MITVEEITKKLKLEREGFQGFNPLTKAQKAKLQLAHETLTEEQLNEAQVAKFAKVTIVSGTDTDAGNGTAVSFDKPSMSTDTLYCLGGFVPFLVTDLLNVDNEFINAKAKSNKNIDLVEIYTSEPTPDPE